jgi:hypothetical protein
MASLFFAMRNNHSRECGEPPAFHNDTSNRYFGYFENPSANNGYSFMTVMPRRVNSAAETQVGQKRFKSMMGKPKRSSSAKMRPDGWRSVGKPQPANGRAGSDVYALSSVNNGGRSLREFGGKRSLA